MLGAAILIDSVDHGRPYHGWLTHDELVTTRTAAGRKVVYECGLLVAV